MKPAPSWPCDIACLLLLPPPPPLLLLLLPLLLLLLPLLSPPAGNLVNYGGSVDVSLWTTQVPAPSAQYVTGTKPDGSPSYMSFDPSGESTRGLPQPRYGELKNFGYVPKPGQVRTQCLAACATSKSVLLYCL